MRRLRQLSSMFFLLLGFSAIAEAAGPDSPCGKTATIQRNDTLSSIAARCDASEISLLDANPGIQGSSDLQVGATLHVPAAGGEAQGVGAAVSSFSRQAGNAMSALADGMGSSVDDLLDKNPDLKARVDKLGSTVGLSGDQSHAAVTILPRSGPPGAKVTITANGLRPNSPVAIGAGAPGAAYSIIGHTQSTAEGTLETDVTVPNDFRPGQDVVFSIATDSHVAARARRFAVSQ